MVAWFVSIQLFTSAVMNDDFPRPLTSRKNMMSVIDIPPKMPMAQRLWSLYLKVNTRRVIHITIYPNTNAIATDRNIPSIIDSALSVFISCAYVRSLLFISLTMARAVLPPSSSNTIDTVDDVGMPKVLNMSSSITSLTPTARNMQITSLM